MHIETHRMRVLAQFMAKLAGRVQFVGALVFRKTHIAVNAKHRAAMRTRIGNKMRRYLAQPGRHRIDERAHRLHHRLLIVRFVFVKPFPIVVFRKRVEEFKEFRCEHSGFPQNWPAQQQND